MKRLWRVNVEISIHDTALCLADSATEAKRIVEREYDWGEYDLEADMHFWDSVQEVLPGDNLSRYEASYEPFGWEDRDPPTAEKWQSQMRERQQVIDEQKRADTQQAKLFDDT